MFRRHPRCKHCESPMYMAQGSTVWVCPQCDRRRCRARTAADHDKECGTVLIRGDEVICPRCGSHVGMQ